MTINLEYEREVMRRDAVITALYESYPGDKGMGLILAGLADRPDLALNHDVLRAVLDYERDRGHVITRSLPPKNVLIARLTVAGIDAVEAQQDFDTERRHRNRMLRLRLMTALQLVAGSQSPWLGEKLMRAYLVQDTDLDLTHPNVPRALAYLSELHLIELQIEHQLARLLPDGIDYLDGVGADRPGIARPVRF